MKIAIISPWFSDKMGYAENYLPAALGKLGHEVHLVTTDLQIYGTFKKTYDAVYRAHLGPPVVSQGVFPMEAHTLHRLPHCRVGGLGIVGLREKLDFLRPDIVYCFEILDKNYNIIISERKKFGYKIFSESRIHTSIFKPPVGIFKKIRQALLARKSCRMAKEVSLFYPIAQDVYDNITKYFGIPANKCKLASLAVDTSIFYRFSNQGGRTSFRLKHGYTDSDIVCLYTGRFTTEKGPHILAEAIGLLVASGRSEFKAMFVGQGDPECTKRITDQPNCRIHPFVKVAELPFFYNYLDIGVWPRQESTSQLDAAGCGMPIILDDAVEDKIRIEGNGLTFRNGAEGLAEQLLKLSDINLRKRLSVFAEQKIAQHYSWTKLASDKIKDFQLTI